VKIELPKSRNDSNKYETKYDFIFVFRKLLNFSSRLFKSIIKRHSMSGNYDQQPCFPTQNDRIAFINESSIEERCVRFVLLFPNLYFSNSRDCYKPI
jgi:hypothetical protein